MLGVTNLVDESA